MLRNYFTLYHIARELHEQLAGGYLFEIHSQDRNELTISFVTPDGRHRQLIVTVRSRDFSISTREGLNRKRRNTAGILKQAYELQVTGVSMAPCDREIRISLEGDFILAIRFFSADTNVLLVQEGRIVDAFKDARDLAGTPWDEGAAGEPVFRALERLAADAQGFAELLDASDDSLPLERRLASFLPGFDRDLARRLVARSGDSPTAEALFRTLGGMVYELASPTPYVVEAPGEAPDFTIVEPEDRSGHATPYDEVTEALNQYARRMHRHLHLHAGAGTLRRELRQQIARAEKEHAELDAAGLDEAAERYETFGHLLMGAIGTTSVASGKVTLPNIYEAGEPWIAIPVRTELNIQQNAAWYFGRATKSREKRAAAKARRAQLDDQLRTLRRKLDQLEGAESEEHLQQLIGKTGSGKTGAQTAGRRAGERQARFRTVHLAEGITLYIGKDARNNELLTFGMARPDDIWLHAQGTSGSHCILKGACLHNMSEIRRAAEIAAWYSAAKTSSLVPVMYTLRKYVRKDRKAIGSVLVEREKVVMVKPGME